MLAIVAQPGSSQPRLVEINSPAAPQEGEILCRTLELGVCGTDREILLSQSPSLPDQQPFLVLGHECLARVEAVGSGVTDFQPGDLVVPAVRRPVPGATRRVDLLDFTQCTERGIHREHGFSSPFWLDRTEFLYRVPASIASVAIFTEPLSVAEKGFNEALLLQQARLGPEVWASANPPRVLVTGLGPIGFAAVLAAKARNWPVTIFGRDRADSFRAQLAQDLGATYLSAQEANWELADVERDGFDLCLECTGSEEVMLAAAQSLASCGVMVWLGCSRVPEAATCNVGLLMHDSLIRNHLHIGSVNCAPRDFHDALAHLSQLKQSHATQLAALFTKRVKPTDALEEYIHRQSQGIKTVVMYD